LNLAGNRLQRGRPLNAIVARNDVMALGADKAIEAAGKANEIPVVGVDAIADAVTSVKEGETAAVVFQDRRRQGATAVELAVKSLEGDQVPKGVDIPFTLIAKEDVSILQ
jgi:ABC-type sugar transport system substrate-binding protein